MRKVNGFEGGSNEDGTGTGTLTTTNSNGSSVVSGTTLDSVITQAGTTQTFDNTVSMYGTYSIKQTFSGTSGQCFFTYDITAAPTLWGGFGYRVAANNVARMICQIRGSSVQAARVTLSATGKVELRNAANTVVATSTLTIANTTFYRIKPEISDGASVLSRVYIYTDDQAAPAETLSATSNFGANDPDEIRYGAAIAAASLPDAWFDAVVATDEGLPGPFGGVVTLTPADMTLTAVPVDPQVLASTIDLTPAVMTFTAVPVTPVPQPVTVALTPAVTTLSAVAVTPVPQPVTVSLTSALMTLAAVALTPIPQPVMVNLTPAVVTFSAVVVDPVPGATGSVVNLTPAVMTFVAVAVTPVPQPVVVALSAAVVALVAVPVNPVPGAVTVDLTPAVMSLVAVPVVAVSGAMMVNLVPAVMTLIAGVVTFPSVGPFWIDVQISLVRSVVVGVMGTTPVRGRVGRPIVTGVIRD